MSDLTLRIMHHDGTDEVKDPIPGELSIGRGADNEICPVDPAMSRRHAIIRRIGGLLTINDLETRNGTHVNGRRIERETELGIGDSIFVGSTKIVVVTRGDSMESRRIEATIEVSEESDSREIIAVSDLMTDLVSQVDRIARSDLPVLVTGETGTGKELIAHRIHDRSGRGEGPLVILNCPALAPGLAESELFGVEKGVATDVEARSGRLEEADGGTLFLDEVADLGLDVQAKLLRFLQDGTIERVGGRTPDHADVRLVAATNQDLEEAMENGAFRRDLFFRIAGVHVEIPPLRDRRNDIPSLVKHLLRRRNLDHVRIEPEALAALEAYDYPGNVRELDAIVSRAAALSESGVIGPSDLAIEPASQAEEKAGKRDVAAILEEIVGGRTDFWSAVYRPFMDRELPRSHTRRIIALGLARSGNSIKEFARLIGEEANYRKLVDFLRNNRLLP